MATKTIKDITSVEDLGNKHQKVFAVSASVDFIRNIFDGGSTLNEDDDFENALDNAQGEVFLGNADVAYVVIKVTR